MEQKIPSDVSAVLSRLLSAGHAAFLVGGAVRDLLRGVLPKDYDIASSATPEEVLALFSDVLPTGVRHGTVTVRDYGRPVEVTAFRGDGEYLDFRRPSCVRFVKTVEEDLSRRDFTVNAMAMGGKGEIIDPFHGQADLERGLIRTVGDPRQRFSEDALRMYRAFRFAARLRFEIHPETLRAISECAPLHRNIAAERIFAELEGILASPAPEVMEALVARGLFDHFLEKRPDRLPGIERLSALPEDVSARLAGFFALLLKSGGISALREPLMSLRAPSKLISAMERASLGFASPPEGRAGWKLFAAENGDRAAELLAATLETLKTEENARRLMTEALFSGECRKISELSVNGDDLLALGFRGREIGDTLHTLLRRVIEHPEENERENLLGRVRKMRGGS